MLFICGVIFLLAEGEGAGGAACAFSSRLIALISSRTRLASSSRNCW